MDKNSQSSNRAAASETELPSPSRSLTALVFALVKP